MLFFGLDTWKLDIHVPWSDLPLIHSKFEIQYSCTSTRSRCLHTFSWNSLEKHRPFLFQILPTCVLSGPWQMNGSLIKQSDEHNWVQSALLLSHIRSKIHGREPAELIHIPNSLQETLTMKYYQFYKITWKLLYINSSLLSPCVQNDDASSSPVLKRRVVISSRARMQPTAISNSGHFRISQVLLILILNQSPNKPYLLVFHQFRCSTERPSTKIEATHLVPKAPKYPGLQFFFVQCCKCNICSVTV